MSIVNEELFANPDPKNPDYSLVEYDLHARLGLSIRKNLKTGMFEIFEIKTKRMVSQGSLRAIVSEANRLEGSENTTIGERKGVLAVN